jgi:tape measure domain-containing protein
METDKGGLFYATGIDNSKLRIDAAESRNILAGIGQSAIQEGARMDAAFNQVAKTLGGLFAISRLKDTVAQIVEVRSEIQRLQTSFKTLAGESKGDALFSEIRQFATSTPMMMKDLAAGAQTMLAFNIEAEKVMPILKSIGDISMGDAQKFNSLTLAFSQMSATGKLMGQDLLQMINAGFNPLSVISEKTGKSIGELKEEMEQGKITTQMVTEAFMSATSEGGKFYGMLEKQSHGIKGAISNFEGAIDDALNDMGASVQDTTIGIINTGTYLVQHYDTILDIVGVLIATYGTYRAALIVNAAVEQMMAKASAERIALIEAEISAVGVKTAQEQLATDADIAAAVSKGNLTEAEGLHILALKKEAAARVESLALAAKQAAAELAAATAARQNAGVRLQAAEANATAMRIEYEAALAKGEVFEIALAKERMETAQTEINTASQQYQAAATAEATAVKTAQTAQTTANSAAQQLNNIQVQQGTVQTGIFATAVRMLTNTLKALWATMMKHPGALILAAVVALGAAIYNVTKKTKELSEEQQILDDVTGQATAKVADEKTKIETLSGIVHDNTKKLEERKTALLALQEIVPDYHAALTAEGNLINDNTDALNRYIDALLKAAKLEAIKGGITETFKELTNLAMDVKNDRSDYGAFLNFFTSDQNIEKNKKQWTAWYNDFIKDPSKYTRKGQGGRTEVLMGSGLSAQWLHADMGEDWISESERDLIKAAGKYAEFSRLYKNILAEDVTTNSKPSTAPKKYKDEVAEQRKALADAQAEVKRLEASATATTAEVKNAHDAVELAEKKLKELGVDIKAEQKSGKNANHIATETAERNEKIRQYSESVIKAQKEAEFEIRQNEINLLKDGLEKTLRQNDLNYDRLIFANKQRRTDMVESLRDKAELEWTNANPKAKDQGKVFDRSAITENDLSEEQKKILMQYETQAQEIRIQGEKEALEAILADVLTYEEQRLKIAEEYARKRAALYTEDENGFKVLRTGFSESNVAELNKQERKSLKELNSRRAAEQLEQLKGDINWDVIFGNVSNLTGKQLKLIKKQLQEFYNSPAFRMGATPEQLKTIADAMEKINEAERNNSGFFAGLSDALSTYDSAKLRFENAELDLDMAKQTGNKDIIAIMQKRYNEAQSNLLSAQGAVGDATDAVVTNFKTVSSALSSLSNEAGLSLTQLGGTIETLINTFGNSGSKIGGIISAALSLLDAIGKQGLDGFVGKVLNGVSQGVGGVLDTVGGIFGIDGLGGLFNGDSRKEKRIESLQGSIDSLTRSNTRLERANSKLYSREKASNYGSQIDNLEAQKRLILQQMAEEEAKKDTNDDRIQEWRNQIEDIGQQIADLKEAAKDAIIGEDITTSIDNFATAMGDAWGRTADKAKAVKDYVRSLLRQMVVEAMKTDLTQPITQLREMMLGYMSDGIVSDVEQAEAQSFMSKVSKDISDRYKWADSILGGSASGQDGATKGGFATATQDSVDELGGRAAAIQICGEARRELLTNIRVDVAELKAQVAAGAEISAEMRGLMLIAASHLETIARNTDELYEMNERLGKIERNTR